MIETYIWTAIRYRFYYILEQTVSIHFSYAVLLCFALSLPSADQVFQITRSQQGPILSKCRALMMMLCHPFLIYIFTCFCVTPITKYVHSPKSIHCLFLIYNLFYHELYIAHVVVLFNLDSPFVISSMAFHYNMRRSCFVFLLFFRFSIPLIRRSC